MIEVLSDKELQPPSSHIAVSASELFADRNHIDELWPPEVAQDLKFQEQIEAYNERVDIVNGILDTLPQPNTSLQTAIELELLTENEVVKLYSHISQVLSNPDYKRLALYLPFEFLPDTSWTPKSEVLTNTIEDFKTSYLHAWYTLLTTQDVRANFTDGDVLETNLRTGDLPRVVKATHLIPELLGHGLLTPSDILTLYESAESDQLLREGIVEGVLVASDRGLITNADMNLLGLDAFYHHSEVADTSLSAPAILAELDYLAHGGLIETTDATTERRTAWLTKKRFDILIDLYSDFIVQDIENGSLTRDTITSLSSLDDPTLSNLVFIQGVQKAIEHTTIEVAKKVYTSFEYDLMSLYKTGDINLVDRLTQSFRRSYRLGIIDRTFVERLGIVIPTLSGSLSKNLEYMPDELIQVEKAIDSIMSHPILSRLLYPVMSVGGSRLKGYGEQTSDVDLGIFVLPTTSERQKDDIRQYIADIFHQAGIDDEPFEVWLDKDKDLLHVRDVVDDKAVIADSYWTHIFFGTAWVGQPQAVKTLRKGLLPSYFNDSDDRQFYLERLEQDILQYRLMHKGYDRHYPRFSHIASAHSDMIDGDSAFWDSGYRQLASRLFIEKVFLPKL